MITALAAICVLIWLPVFLYQMTHRGSLILLIWLLIAPIASNIINKPGENPFFFRHQAPQELLNKVKIERGKAYLTAPTSITLNELSNPTRMLFSMFLVIFAMNSILKNKRWIRLDKSEISMLMFSLILITNVLLLSRRTAFGLRIATDAFIIPFLAYYISRNLITNEDRFRQLVRIIAYMGIYLIVICIAERLTNSGLFYRLQGPFQKPNVLYQVLAVIFFTVLADWASNRRFPEKQALSHGIRRFVLFLAPISILLTLSRQSWLGFLTGVCMFLLLGRRLIQPKQKFGMVGLALALVPIVVIGIEVLLPQEFIEQRVTGEQNVHGRFATWMVTIKEGIKHPVFGMGLNNMRDILAIEQLVVEGTKSYRTVHNAFLAIFAELGAVGLLAYFAVVASIVRMGLSLFQMGMHPQDGWRGVAIIVLLVSHLVPALFDTTLQVTDLSHVYLYVVIGGIVGLYSQRHWVVDPYPSDSDHRETSTDRLAVTP